MYIKLNTVCMHIENVEQLATQYSAHIKEKYVYGIDKYFVLPKGD